MSHANRANAQDPYVEKILGALLPYKEKHTKAILEAYRRNSASVRVRVIDPDFKGMDRVDRESAVWGYFEPLPGDVQSEISMLVLVTPKERKTSLASLEFEHPSPSML